MGWLGLLRLALSLTEAVASFIREKQLMDAGAQAQVAVQLAKISADLGVAQAVADEVGKMSDADLDAELRKP